MDRHYTLTSHSGIYTATGDRPTVIGQQEGCDLRLANPSRYADVILCRIVPDSNGDGWHIVRVTPFYPILINGVEMNRVHYLRDGDNIEAGGTALRFNIREGEVTQPSVTHIHRTGKRQLLVLTAAILLLAAMVAYLFTDYKRETLSPAMRGRIERSLLSVRVDSLQLMHGDSVIESYSYPSPPSGTAFLTTDSLIVTARHCLQPWLNAVRPSDFASLPAMTDWPVRAALLAETRNRLDDTDAWRVVSHVTLTNYNGTEIGFVSDEFMINSDDDDIVETGDYNSSYYWRSISHRYTSEGMMLGDIAVARFYKGGEIPLATSEEMSTTLSPGTRLYFAGFPESAVGGNTFDIRADELHTPLREVPDEPGRISMLAHDGNLTPGFSGGPVIVRHGGSFVAVGVISVVDTRNANRSYSVPVTEIEKILP